MRILRCRAYPHGLGVAGIAVNILITLAVSGYSSGVNGQCRDAAAVDRSNLTEGAPGTMRPSRRIQRGFRVHSQWVAALQNVQFVLAGITHAGNIGAVARVMKNMALQNLTIVSSTDCGPETVAFSRSSGAYDIVERASFCETLEEALGHTVMSVGTSGRLGGKRVAARSPAEVIPELMESALAGPVAVVFGRESRGLTNEQMKLCTHHLIIPTNAEFASMNVAHAAAVIAYEVFKAASVPVHFQAKKLIPASVEAREDMYEHIESVLIRAGFLDPANPLRMMRDVRRIFNSAAMDDRDVKIVRGIFRKISNMMRIADERVRVKSGMGPTRD
jgi:tRNA (cytidine32/uridine32-2'-O)-methyltransferase